MAETHALTSRGQKMERAFADRIEKKIDDQGKWTAEGFDGIRSEVGEIKVELGKFTTIMQGILESARGWAGVDKRVDALEIAVKGQLGQPGMLQQVRELHEQRIENAGEARANSKTKNNVSLIFAGLTLFVLGGTFVWSLVTWVIPHLH